MPQKTVSKEPDQERPARKQAPEQVPQRNIAGNADSSSLVEALRALVLEMSRIESDAEAVSGLKRLQAIRNSFLGPGSAASVPGRRDAEALIAWVEARLGQLRQQLARKRRIQEGMVMEQIAKQRETEGPQLIPTELIDAVVRSTDAKDPEEIKTTAPQPARQEQEETEQPPNKPKPVPAKKPEPTEEKPDKEPQVLAQAQEAGKPEAALAPEPEKQLPPQAPEKPAPARKADWTKYELLAAHLAASRREDSAFFEKLRRAAKRKGQRMAPPEDNARAEQHYRIIHDLNKRLVNLEAHCIALAIGNQNEKQGPLLRTAARELKLFAQDLRQSKQALPEMAGEYERLFGGWVHQFTAIQPEKGQDILARCQAERQPERREAQRHEQNPEQEAPQLVLRRRNDWEH